MDIQNARNLQSVGHPVQRTPVESGVEGYFEVDPMCQNKDSPPRSGR